MSRLERMIREMKERELEKEYKQQKNQKSESIQNTNNSTKVLKGLVFNLLIFILFFVNLYYSQVIVFKKFLEIPFSLFEFAMVFLTIAMIFSLFLSTFNHISKNSDCVFVAPLYTSIMFLLSCFTFYGYYTHDLILSSIMFVSTLFSYFLFRLMTKSK